MKRYKMTILRERNGGMVATWEAADAIDVESAIEAARAEGYKQGKEEWEEANVAEYWRGKREGVLEERKRWWEAVQSAGIEITDGGQYRADIESGIKHAIMHAQKTARAEEREKIANFVESQDQSDLDGYAVADAIRSME